MPTFFRAVRSAIYAALLLVATMSMTTEAIADDHPAYERRIFRAAEGRELPYRILYPLDYAAGAEAGRRYPLVVFLHGAGERGSDNEQHLKIGASLFADPQNRAEYPAIVVFPQCPADGYWVDLDIRRKLYADEEQDFDEVFAPPTEQLDLAMRLVDRIVSEERVDADRVYLMGLSMGALGSFEFLARRPDRFAAAVAICGGGNLQATERYADKVAIWITHGALDPIVPVAYSRRLHQALVDRGAEVKYTEFPDVKHDAWVPTLAMPDLLPWLFSRSKAEGDGAAAP